MPGRAKELQAKWDAVERDPREGILWGDNLADDDGAEPGAPLKEGEEAQQKKQLASQ